MGNETYKVVAGWLLEPVSGTIPNGRGYLVVAYAPGSVVVTRYMTHAEMQAHLERYAGRGFVKRVLDNDDVELVRG